MGQTPGTVRCRRSLRRAAGQAAGQEGFNRTACCLPFTGGLIDALYVESEAEAAAGRCSRLPAPSRKKRGRASKRSRCRGPLPPALLSNMDARSWATTSDCTGSRVGQEELAAGGRDGEVQIARHAEAGSSTGMDSEAASADQTICQPSAPLLQPAHYQRLAEGAHHILLPPAQLVCEMQQRGGAKASAARCRR